MRRTKLSRVSLPNNPPRNLATPRLLLEVLTPAHAEVMVDVLSHPDIYDFLDDEPPELEFLRQLYRTQSRNWQGRPISWHNWIITNQETGQALGYIQATVNHSKKTAELGWVLAPEHQGQGIAREANQRVMGEISSWGGCQLFYCHIDSGNYASQRLAQALGFTLTESEPGCEQRWERKPQGS